MDTPTIYDVAIDERRPVTQQDIEMLRLLVGMQGRFISQIRKALEYYDTEREASWNAAVEAKRKQREIANA